jgi:hypothetical protein
VNCKTFIINEDVADFFGSVRLISKQRLLAVPCPSRCPRVSVPLPLDGFP